MLSRRLGLMPPHRAACGQLRAFPILPFDEAAAGCGRDPPAQAKPCRTCLAWGVAELSCRKRYLGFSTNNKVKKRVDGAPRSTVGHCGGPSSRPARRARWAGIGGLPNTPWCPLVGNPSATAELTEGRGTPGSGPQSRAQSGPSQAPGRPQAGPSQASLRGQCHHAIAAPYPGSGHASGLRNPARTRV